MKNTNNYRSLFIGIDDEISIYNGNKIVPINLDNGATTPALKECMKCVSDMLYVYSSIGRGKGYKAKFCNEFYENSRKKILNFFNVKKQEDYTVIYVKNATEGLNLLAKSLVNKRDYVITTRMEHHANDLPWRENCNVLYVDVNDKGLLNKEKLESLVRKNRGKAKYITITGASNVTGYLNPINKIAKLAHENGMKIIVDAAQLVAHKEINMGGSGDDDHIDFLVFSAHKMYAPFGCGVVIALKDDIKDKEPLLRGGGAVDLVSDNKVYLDSEPERFEAGTPNIIGVCALLSAIRIIGSIGFEKIEQEEERLRDYLLYGLESMPDIITYGDSNYKERIGVAVFNVRDVHHDIISESLADLRGIAVRNGTFCAHPYARRLLGIKDEEFCKYAYSNEIRPGMLRVSLGLYNSKEEVDEFLNTLEIVKRKDFKL
ncbi:aminotransferase class V-fold PLP-dependent enzyme [Clostridium sp. B9]|uniref:aminotransferase class V-fold PLP-dependent enzyme n=1 Tax=Clostridium sp. B9 TaxID=3423224 RepID=UPI003D2F13CA